MKIEFGCGETPRKKNFKTCDIRKLPKVDFVCKAWEIDLFVEPNSVEEIYSRHFFEHLTFKQGEQVLKKWFYILKNDGLLEIVLPNMTFHINQWINKKNNDSIKHAKAGFWGWQRGSFEDTWDCHNSGYDLNLLQSALDKIGYRNIISHNNLAHQHLHITCNK